MRKPPSQNPVPQQDLPGHALSYPLSRRAVLAGLPLLLAGCGANYGSTQDGGFTVAAVDMTAMDRDLMRQEVAWHGKEKPGSIVVNVPQRRLYLVLRGGRALRYGVGVGRTEGMNFRGNAVIGRKEK
jgi:lipoprotein-anchoring transpeptidase ErfK/SrfK